MGVSSKYIASPLPWKVKRTGSSISIIDKNRAVIIKKIVNNCSIEEYKQLSCNFDFIVSTCNSLNL